MNNIQTTGKKKTHQIGLYCNYYFKDDGFDTDLNMDNVEDLEIELNVDAIFNNLINRYMFQYHGTISYDDLKEFIETVKKDPLTGHTLQVCLEPGVMDHNQYPIDGGRETEAILAVFPLKPIIKLVPQSPITEAEAKIVETLNNTSAAEVIERAAEASHNKEPHSAIHKQ